MDYALCLRYGNPSTFPQVSSTRPNIIISQKKLITKSHDFLTRNSHFPSKFSPSNFCDTTSKLLRNPQGHHALISPMALARRRFSAPSSTDQLKSNCESARIISSSATIGASLALACFLGIFCFILSPRKAMAFSFPFSGSNRPQQTSSMPQMSLSVISGKEALSAFMEWVVFLGSPMNKSTPARKFYRPDVAALKEEVLRQMKNGELEEVLKKMKKGDSEEALKQLKHGDQSEKALKRMKDGVKSIDDPEGKEQANMALAEVLILQGKYEEALKRLKSTRCSDVRHSLYKAIIYTILDDKEEAMKSWNEFVEIGFQDLPNPSSEPPK